MNAPDRDRPGRDRPGRDRPGRGRPAQPVRTCVGCRGRDEKSALLRLVWSPSGLLVDAAQHQPGRGAYLHPQPACLARAVKRRTLGRALRVDQLPATELERVSAAYIPPLG